MANAKPKMVVTQRMTAACPTHSRTDISVRDITVVSDEPPERGGDNAGAAPTELLVAALAACTNVIFHKCAAKHGVEINTLDIEAIAQFDRRGVTLQEEIAVPYPEIKLVIRLTTAADFAAIEAAKNDLAKFCPVAKVIRGSGTHLLEEWHVSRPTA